ncbi:MAG: AAA family ATPase [Candidatus Hodarchaeales archaeon]|jgi:MoxR-like ATPase
MKSLDSKKLEQAGYIANDAIMTIVNLAMHLNKPILVEGPAGTGKTSIAIAAAKALSRELIRIQCYEGITSESIIGEFDYKKQLLTIELAKSDVFPEKKDQLMNDIFSEEYFIKRPLMRAFTNKEPVVLLIDEIDKSDEEFEAFLLETLGELQITVPELGTFVSKHPPLVFLTSNATRDLSEALRRRGLYLYLDFPSLEVEKQILQLHCPDTNERFLEQLASTVAKLRKLDLKKPPSLAESIDWVKTLLYLGHQELNKNLINQTLNILLKHVEDIEAARVELDGINLPHG